MLTVCDIRGVGPDVWNNWKASLLRGLYRQTRRAIRRYQRSADLPVTGYLTPSIVARLMAEGMVDILR